MIANFTRWVQGTAAWALLRDDMTSFPKADYSADFRFQHPCWWSPATLLFILTSEKERLPLHWPHSQSGKGWSVLSLFLYGHPSSLSRLHCSGPSLTCFQYSPTVFHLWYPRPSVIFYLSLWSSRWELRTIQPSWTPCPCKFLKHVNVSTKFIFKKWSTYVIQTWEYPFFLQCWGLNIVLCQYSDNLTASCLHFFT